MKLIIIFIAETLTLLTQSFNGCKLIRRVKEIV